MKPYFQSYFNSFKVKKVFWQTLAVDLIYFGFLWMAFSQFSVYLQNRAITQLGGMSIEQLRNLLLTSPQQALPYLQELKSFLTVAIIGFALLTLASFLLFSLSQGISWNLLLGKKLTSKTYWRWNVLNLVLLFPLLLYVLLFIIFTFLFKEVSGYLMTALPSLYYNYSTAMDTANVILNSSFMFLLLLFVLVWLFLAYSAFTEKVQVWLSLGESFQQVKKQWAKIWRMLLLMLLTAVIISILLIPVKNFLFLYPLAEKIAQFLISLLFLAWMRVYFLSALRHEHPPAP